MAATPARVLDFRPASFTDTASGVSPTDTIAATAGDDTGGAATPVVSPTKQSTTVLERASELATIQDLGNGHGFIHPLFVRLEQQGETWFALSDDLSLVGEGESDSEAIDALRSQIGELYESLIEMRDTLGPHLQHQLAFLERLAGTPR